MSVHHLATKLRRYTPADGEVTFSPRWIHVVPVSALIAALAVDVFTPPPVTGGILLILGSMVAASFYSFRGVMVVALLNLAVGTGFLIRHLHSLGMHGVVDYASLVLLLVASLVVNRLRLRAQSELHAVRATAEVTQRAVLPPVRAELGDVHIAVRYEAASSAAAIGGDLYAAEYTSFGVRLLIGDVRGKGLGAVSAVAMLVGAFREAAHHAQTLPELAHWLDASVTRFASDIPDASDLEIAEHFITAMVVEVQPGQDTALLINRGHCPAFVVRNRGAVDRWEPADPGLPLGLGELDPGDWSVGVLPFAAGDLLLLCTDGMLEARDSDGDFYSPEDDLRQSAPAGPAAVVYCVAHAARKHSGGHLADDLAVMAVTRRQPGSAAPFRDHDQ
ncbi:PP2C family protein-serine/threonine phosphatase [Streptomyces wedmorensis]|uniref:PP2C family protein-serine/threonine phosphatase n=1 Tax=Streptomyces wedmorensis TaxID=43759 RepID=UPI003799D21E